MTLTTQQVQDIQQGQVRQEAMDYALELLGRRLHSRAELLRKLTRAGQSAELANLVLDDLTRLGYVNDERFAKNKALSAAEHKQHGRRRAYVELIKAGVPNDLAGRALDDVYSKTSSIELARQLARKQSARLSKLDPLTARRRLVGMLQRRGFDYESIRPVIDEVLGPEID